MFLLAHNLLSHINLILTKVVRPEAQEYPTTQKAVVQAIIDSKLSNSSHGCRIVAMDNRYSAIPLFLDLRTKHNILAVGTIRGNRKYWNKEIMNLSKKSKRGSYLVKYDRDNEILAGQWNDNKVVPFISTLGEYDIVKVKRRVKKKKIEFDVPEPLRSYQRHMGGVDKNDQIKECAGGISKGIRKTHKWFKAVNLAIMDIGIVNSSIAWNMKAVTLEGVNLGLNQAPINDFQTYLADEMINFVDTKPRAAKDDRGRFRNNGCSNQHVPSTAVPSTKNPVCRICKLEYNFRMKYDKHLTKLKKGTGYRDTNNLKQCETCKKEGINVHLHDVERADVTHNLIFQMEEFKGLTCFDIYHHDLCKGLFKLDKNKKLQVQRKHIIMKTLEDKWKAKANSSAANVTPPSPSPSSSSGEDQRPPVPVIDYPDGLEQIPGKLPPNWAISPHAAPNGKRYYYDKTGKYHSQWDLVAANEIEDNRDSD